MFIGLYNKNQAVFMHLGLQWESKLKGLYNLFSSLFSQVRQFILSFLIHQINFYSAHGFWSSQVISKWCKQLSDQVTFGLFIPVCAHETHMWVGFNGWLGLSLCPGILTRRFYIRLISFISVQIEGFTLWMGPMTLPVSWPVVFGTIGSFMMFALVFFLCFISVHADPCQDLFPLSKLCNSHCDAPINKLHSEFYYSCCEEQVDFCAYLDLDSSSTEAVTFPAFVTYEVLDESRDMDLPIHLIVFCLLCVVILAGIIIFLYKKTCWSCR